MIPSFSPLLKDVFEIHQQQLVITFSSCCLVPRIRNSVLSGLSFNQSISIQFCRSRMQDCIDDTAAVSLVELPGLKAKYN